MCCTVIVPFLARNGDSIASVLCLVLELRNRQVSNQPCCSLAYLNIVQDSVAKILDSDVVRSHRGSTGYKAWKYLD